LPKTVAISGLSASGYFGVSPIRIGLLYEAVYEAVQEIVETPGRRQRARTSFTHMAAEAGKEVAEALRDVVVVVAGEAVKRAIWG
jgi:hypothetical protein